MRLLIIGGTRFLGRALVQAAQSRGHQITLFNRGKSNPDLFAEVERITGDRMTSLEALRGREWDAVIDTCGYEPAAVRLSAGFLAGAVRRYIFISSISVYDDMSQPGTDELAPPARLPEGAGEQFNIEYYGPLKALCEQAAEQAMPGRVLTIRPGLIVGENDPTDRFTYWPWRIAQGGDVLAPGRPALPAQFIDVRDLADWTICMAEQEAAGTYNATGPGSPLTMGQLLDACRAVSGSSAELHWLPETFLLENGVQPWSELPLWLPENEPQYAGMNQVSVQKALRAGLTYRPLEDTIQITLNWASQRPAAYQWRAGLPREREAELLAKFGRLAGVQR